MTTTTIDSGVQESGPPPKVAWPLAELAAAYDLGTWQAVRWMRGGKNEHAELVTDRSVFFLRRSYRSKTLASLQWQVELLNVLRGHGLPVPLPLPGRAGGPILTHDERLYVVTEALPGEPYRPDQPEHLRAMGRVLATYHALAPTLGVAGPDPDAESILDSLRERLTHPGADAVPELYEHGRAIAGRLGELWPGLPVTVLHGGCRRGSMLFTGSVITGLLDFDSARVGPRCLDVATAVHDVSKIYTESGQDDHKVTLDLERMRTFLDAYREHGELTPDEITAIPLLIAAKRARRGLGRSLRLDRSQGALQVDDLDKIRLELARLSWLSDHAADLRAACAG